MVDLSLCMGDNVELLKVFLNDMFYFVDNFMVLIICPSVSDRGYNAKFRVINLCGKVVKFDDISETSEGPPESF